MSFIITRLTLELGRTILDAFFHLSSLLDPKAITPSYMTSCACATFSNLVLWSLGGLKVSSFLIAFKAPEAVSFILYTLCSQLFQLKYNTVRVLVSTVSLESLFV